MKAHKYWSVGALITMIGTFYTGYKGLKAAHKYFAFGSLICMIMAVYSGHKMISGNKRWDNHCHIARFHNFSSFISILWPTEWLSQTDPPL